MIDRNMSTEPWVLSGPEQTELEKAFAGEREQAQTTARKSREFQAMRQAAIEIAAHAVRYEAQREELESQRSKYTPEGLAEEHRKIRDERDQKRRELIATFEAEERKLRVLGSPANADELFEGRGEPIDARDATRIATAVSIGNEISPQQFVEGLTEATQQRDRPLLAALLPLAKHHMNDGGDRYGKVIGQLSHAIKLGEQARQTARTRTRQIANDPANQSRIALKAYMTHVDKNGAVERVEMETVHGNRLPNW
jgi:hypothetical protein